MELNHTNWPANGSAAKQQTIIMQGPHFWVENTCGKPCEAQGSKGLVDSLNSGDLDEGLSAEVNSDDRWFAPVLTQMSFQN